MKDEEAVMSVRESIDRHRPIAVGAAVAVIAAAVFLIVRNSISSSSMSLMSGTRDFYSVDDGQTWFVDKAEQVPPYDHDGKTAYRARVFSVNGGKPFCAYLERYAETARKRLAAAERGDRQAAGLAEGRPISSLMSELANGGGLEIKKPGAGNPWVRRDDAQLAGPIIDVKGPDGAPASPVLP
jgi:hypothetical protein